MRTLKLNGTIMWVTIGATALAGAYVQMRDRALAIFGIISMVYRPDSDCHDLEKLVNLTNGNLQDGILQQVIYADRVTDQED